MLDRKRHDVLSARFAAIICALLILLCPRHIQAQSEAKQSPSRVAPRHFTVRDSIELTEFGGSDTAGPIPSPNGNYFAVVTSRGVIQSDTIESTLWVFRSDQLRAFLRDNNNTARSPLPKMVANVRAIPQVPARRSNALINSVRWMPSSTALVYLSQHSHAKSQLYRADLISGSVRALTTEDVDVTGFDVANGAIVYRTRLPEENREAGEPINADARDLTGVPLQSILFPETQSVHSKYDALWIIQNGRNGRITDRNTGTPIRLTNRTLQILSISPNGRSVVTWQPSAAAPLSWFDYEPAEARARLRPNDPNVTAESNLLRPTQYVAVNLIDGSVTPLIKAPLGWTFGYGDTTQASWSPDGKKVLLTNTFLPLDGVSEPERLRRLRPCAAAVVDPPSDDSKCVAFSNFTAGRSGGSRLAGASFGETSDDVALSFWDKTERRYHYQSGSWQPSSLPTKPGEQISSGAGASAGISRDTLSLQVKEDLNTPPALWATDLQTGKSKQIWDPNPRLAEVSLGEESVFHWKDATGHEWTGGLVKPPDYVPGKRYPMVIQTHGFYEFDFSPDGLDVTGFAARPLAAVGIVVLQVEDRWDHLVTPDEAPDNILGYESAIERLASDGLIDPSKVGIIGFSRTCYYVESALIKNPSRFAAAVIADGVDESYMQYMLFDVGRSPNEGTQIYGSAPFGDGLKKWTERAPGFNLNRIQTPIRLIAAGNATSILSEWEIYASLLQQSKPVTLIYFPGGQHVLWKPLERLAAQQGNVDWFRFWLQGYEDPDPAKVQQYARWRELRTLQEANNANAKAGKEKPAPVN